MIAKIINLDSRQDRWKQCEAELSKHFTVERVSAIKHDSGWVGLAETYKDIFSKADGDVLIFEDDATYNGTINDLLDAINDLPQGWEMLMLGANLIRKETDEISDRVYRTYGSLHTHAIYYSHKFCKEMSEVEFTIPIDKYFLKNIHNRGNSYVVYPFLSYQRPSHSDINKCYTDYTDAFKGSEKILRNNKKAKK